jgi:hypothetical protein
MKNNFVPRGLHIGVNRDSETKELVLWINSDYSRSNHKGRLYVDAKRLASEVESLWKSIKTKKLLRMSVSFDEIDWYDDMTDIYETPKVTIKRGLRKAVISYREHGSIPKDWEFGFNAVIANTTTSTPILIVARYALGSYFNANLEKQFRKALKPVLQKKTTYCSVNTEY